MIRVLGIDPGGTTGLALLEYDIHVHPAGWHLYPAQSVTLEGVHSWVVAGFRAGPDAVAMEQFVVGRRAGRSSTASAGQQARDIIGAVTALCKEAGVPVVLRTASVAKGWATDERLKAAGLYVPTRGLGHARDATRHALYTAHWYLQCPDPLSTKERT